MSANYDHIDKIFFEDGYKLAKQHLNASLSNDNFLSLSEDIYHSIDALIEALCQRLHSENRRLECKKACHWCCGQPVYANQIEMNYLTEFINKSFSGEKQKTIKDKAEAKRSVTKDLDFHQQKQVKHFCPFLIDKICSVYKARPMSCRIYLSMDIHSCIDNFHNPDDKDKYPKLYDFPLHAGRMLNEGVAAWLAEKDLILNETPLENLIFTHFNKIDEFSNWVKSKK